MDNNLKYAPVSVDICVCTFQRPHLVSTLASLAQMNVYDNWQVRVIVADNDTSPSAEHIIKAAQGTFPFPLTYIHAPARNISIARNACLNAASGDYIAFIDDDETASPNWLVALIAQQQETHADVVLGPVQSRYPAQCPTWLRAEDFHSIKPVWVDGQIITGYTSNTLFVREAPALSGLRFDPKLGKSGGEDTVFFSAIHHNGGRIDYAPNATIIEDVARERLTFMWLLKRYFRAGQTHAVLLLTDGTARKRPRYLNVLIAGAKAGYCAVASLVSLITAGRAQYWLLRGTLHAGVVARLLGVTELIQYG